MAQQQAKLDLNLASPVELARIDGVTTPVAEAIVDYRRRHGEFQTLESLKDIDGVGPATYEKLSRHGVLNGSHRPVSHAASEANPVPQPAHVGRITVVPAHALMNTPQTAMRCFVIWSRFGVEQNMAAMRYSIGLMRAQTYNDVARLSGAFLNDSRDRLEEARREATDCFFPSSA